MRSTVHTSIRIDRAGLYYCIKTHTDSARRQVDPASSGFGFSLDSPGPSPTVPKSPPHVANKSLALLL
jgi:hypothetical protein